MAQIQFFNKKKKIERPEHSLTRNPTFYPPQSGGNLIIKESAFKAWHCKTKPF